jgi:hypothetical protein
MYNTDQFLVQCYLILIVYNTMIHFCLQHWTMQRVLGLYIELMINLKKTVYILSQILTYCTGLYITLSCLALQRQNSSCR